MFCARCDEPIAGTPQAVNVDGGTGAGSTVYICPKPCRSVPRQTYQRPVERYRPRRRR